MKSKSIALLVIFCFGLIPMGTAQSESGISHTLEDALLFMLTSEAILLTAEEDQVVSSSSFLSAPVWDEGDEDLDDKTMAAILQALKDWRNELDTNCKLLTDKLVSEGRDCEADRVKATCDQYRQQINGEIGKYHDLRGDKRKAPTKVWHFLKRNGRTLWNRIGPVGRTFLRRLGPEVAQTVLSGGTLSGGVLRKLVKGVARSLGREKIKNIVFQGVERLLKGQIEILQAAGVDICEDPDQDQIQEEIQDEVEEVTEEEIVLPDSGTWKVSCVHTFPDVIEEYGMPAWQMELNWETRTFTGKIDAISSEIDGNETISWKWNESGGGTITEDGLLWGDSRNSLTLSVQYGDRDPTLTDYSYDGHWIGAISADLERICMYRDSEGGWFTPDWLREQGINVMLEEGSGLCEADCAAP